MPKSLLCSFVTRHSRNFVSVYPGCLSNWQIRTFPDRVVLKQVIEPFILPKFEILVDDSLGFTVKVYGCYLPEDHPVYLNYQRTVQNVTISGLVKELEENCSLCCGVGAVEMTSKLFHHVVPTSESSEEGEQFPHKGYWRVKGCLILCKKSEQVCWECSEYLACIGRVKKAKERHQLKPAHVNAPVSKTDPERIKLTLQKQRLRCAVLERDLNEMRHELQKANIEVDQLKLKHPVTPANFSFRSLVFISPNFQSRLIKASDSTEISNIQA